MLKAQFGLREKCASTQAPVHQVSHELTPSIRLSRLLLTLFYLAGPLLIIWELFTPALSVPILLLSAAYIVLLASSLRRPRPADAKVWRASHLVAGIAAFALSVAWVYYSGIGSFAICRWDYVKHNLIFSYLLDQKLPIHIALSNQDFILHYSFAYYITPVRLYQVAHALAPGITLNGVLLVIYSGALFLATSILSRGQVAFLLALLAILCLTGGLDLLGMLAFGVEPQGKISTSWGTLEVPFNLDWWGIPYAPQSFTMNLYYAPQHFFGALIGTALLCASLQSNEPAGATLIESVIVVAASAFWSPYVAVGLAALAIVMVLSLDTHGTFLQRLRQGGILGLLAPPRLIVFAFAALLVIAASLFLLASKPLSSPQLILRQDNILGWLLTYAVNYAPYLLALILVVWPVRKFSSADAGELRFAALPKILAGCLVASAAALAFSHGFHNDWGMRVTLPLSIALAAAVTKVLFSGLNWPYVAALSAVLAVSSASSLSELTRSMLLPANCKRYGAFQFEDTGALAPQYEGRSDSVLYRYLVRSH